MPTTGPSQLTTSSRTVTHVGLAVGALMALVALAGCGSGSSSTSPAPAVASTSATSSSAHSPSHSDSGSTKPSSAPSASSTPQAPHPTEFSPPGDIPDNAVFVDHTAPGSQVHFTVPEGWAESTTGETTTYTDKYNSVGIEVRQQLRPSTVSSATSTDVPALQKSEPKFQLEDVTQVTRQHGTAILVSYLKDSAPDPVTDKVVRDEVLRFQFWHAGQGAVLSLTGPQNADNVDPWQIVSDSLEWK